MSWKKKYNSPRILTSILDDSGICGLWGNRASLPSKVWDALTWRKKMLTFPSPTPPPSPTSPDPGDGVIRSKSIFFQYSINTTQHHQRYLYRDTMRGSRTIFVAGGSRLLNLFYSLKRGFNGFITHFPGGCPTFSRGGGPIETHITITCDFPGCLDPLSPLCIRTWTLWHFGTNRLRRACADSF